MGFPEDAALGVECGKNETKRADHDAYMEYLHYVVGGSPPKEPKESYTDWAGHRILCFDEWKLNKKAVKSWKHE